MVSSTLIYLQQNRVITFMGSDKTKTREACHPYFEAANKMAASMTFYYDVINNKMASLLLTAVTVPKPDIMSSNIEAIIKWRPR